MSEQKLREWCQPGDMRKRQFLVTFDDPDCRTAVFDDEGEARAFWERANQNWNCYLFGAMPRAVIPVPRGGHEPNWWEEWVKTTRAYNALAKAAQAVIDETKAIHDNDPWPTRYRAPYEAITKLTTALAASDKSVTVTPATREAVSK